MSVYFIHASRYFKIGYSENPQRRFDRLHLSGTRYTFPADASWSIDDRTLYRVIEGDKSSEHRIHLALDNFAVGLEWFLDEPEVRAFIDGLPDDAHGMEHPSEVLRPGGFCQQEYLDVQSGRADREMARFYSSRRAS